MEEDLSLVNDLRVGVPSIGEEFDVSRHRKAYIGTSIPNRKLNITYVIFSLRSKDSSKHEKGKKNAEFQSSTNAKTPPTRTMPRVRRRHVRHGSRDR